MSVTIPDFWKLVVDSQLLSGDQCRQLDTGFGQIRGSSADGNAAPLVEWLVSQNALSRYQTDVLLTGSPGPFCYGDYKIYDRIGAGRLSGKFRAVHAATGHSVLLEFLSGVAAQDKAIWRTIVQRTLLLAETPHAHLVRYHEPVDLVTYKMLALEDLRGQSAEDRLAAAGPIAHAEACGMLRMAVQGLAQLHQQGLAHGDIRPANIWIDPGGSAKLLDDPIAQSLPVDITKPDASGAALLRADYLAPELAQAGRAPDMLSDVYALGCTLYHMLAGRPPFAGGDVAQKLARHASEAIEPLEGFGVPQPVAQMVTYMMAKNAGVRYQSLALVDQQIAAFVDADYANIHPPAPAASLAAYEDWLRDQQASLAATMAHKPSVASIPNLGAAAQASAPGIFIANGGSAQSSGVSATAKYHAGSKRKNTTALVVCGAAALALAAAGIVFLAGSYATQPEPNRVANNDTGPADISDGGPRGASSGMNNGETVADPPTTPASVAAETPRQQVVEDDGELLWASPTTGEAVALDFVPPGGQLFVAFRPADLLASGEGEQILRALGPKFAAARTRWEQASGVGLERVEQLIVSLHNNEGRLPRAAFVVHMTEPLDEQALRAGWGGPSVVKKPQGQYYSGNGWAYYVPAGADKRTFVMGEVAEIEQVLEVGGAPPVLRRDVERLRQSSDSYRHLTILLAPNFLFSDGRALFSNEREKLLEPLEWLLGDGILAGMASMHVDGNFYFEMRMIGDVSRSEVELATEVKDRLQQVPDRISQYIVELDPHPYWREVAFGYPGMVRALHRYTRVGAEDDQAVVNSVLPAVAAHNLFFGAELALVSPAGQRVAAGPPQPAGPQTLQDVLQQKLTLAFDQTSLEFSMRDLAADVKNSFPQLPFDFRIKIIGEDLQLNGITRNQQIRDFNEADKPIADILTALVMRANPVQTVELPSEPDQKLIWVIGPDPDEPGKQIILITTRDAAAAKEYTLPAPFQPE